MFCCCYRRKKDKESPQILDVEKILADFVWREFLVFNGRYRCCLRRSNFVIEVPMNYLHFETISQKTWDMKHHGKGVVEKRLREDGSHHTAGGSGSNQAVELRTVYHNGTPNEQTYQFRLEKSRKANLTVTVQKGFSIGGKAKFNLKLPSVTAGVDFDLKYSVSKIHGETIEETATFETSSAIKLEKNSTCEAKAIMEEVNMDCGFKMKILMSLLTNGIPVSIKRKTDGKVVFPYIVSDISRAFKGYKPEIVDPYPDLDKLCKGDNANAENGGPQAVGDNVLFTIYGNIQGTRLSDQRITLESTPLPPRPDQQGGSDGKEDGSAQGADQ